MGDAADDMYNMEMDWQENGEWCEKHQRWYLGGTIGMCPDCEDGEPQALENE